MLFLDYPLPLKLILLPDNSCEQIFCFIYVYLAIKFLIMNYQYFNSHFFSSWWIEYRFITLLICHASIQFNNMSAFNDKEWFNYKQYSNALWKSIICEAKAIINWRKIVCLASHTLDCKYMKIHFLFLKSSFSLKTFLREGENSRITNSLYSSLLALSDYSFSVGKNFEF